MKLELLPEGLRVRLSVEDEDRLWGEVEKEGISTVAERTDYPRHRIYSWRSKDLFLPADFVEKIFDSAEVKALKSEGRGNEIKDLGLEFDQVDELLTRFHTSVYVNKEGVPIYRTDEFSQIRRFRELLEELGEFETVVYSRGFYELRFPKAVQMILSDLDYAPNTSALVDEKGEIGQGTVSIGERDIPVEEFEDPLYSLEKRRKLAIEKGNEDEIKKMIADQVSKANSLL